MKIKPQIGDIYKYSGTKTGYYSYARVTQKAGPSSYHISFYHTPDFIESTVVWHEYDFNNMGHYKLMESSRVKKILENYENDN